MAQAVPQTYENHTRIVPPYHMGVFGILIINLFWSLYRAVTQLSGDTLVSLLLAVALLILFFYVRVFALTVQNRVIRLEMTLRLQQLLPPDLRGRIGELSVPQLVALRFASDEEMCDLCRTVLDQRLSSQKAIKKMIKRWTPDYLRA